MRAILGQIPTHAPLTVRLFAEVRADLRTGSVLAMVPLVIESGSAARANVSLDAGLLAAIDEAAARAGVTRSAFLASAARERIVSGS